MDLEAWRNSQGMTYAQLAELMQVSSTSQMRRLCIGEELLRDERLAKAIAVSDGAVTAYAIHERRMAFLRSRPQGQGPGLSGGETPDGSGGGVNCAAA